MTDEPLSMLYSKVKGILNHQNFSFLKIDLLLGLFLHWCTLKCLISHNGQTLDFLGAWKRKVIEHLQICRAAILSNCSKNWEEVTSLYDVVTQQIWDLILKEKLCRLWPLLLPFKTQCRLILKISDKCNLLHLYPYVVNSFKRSNKSPSFQKHIHFSKIITGTSLEDDRNQTEAPVDCQMKVLLLQYFLYSSVKAGSALNFFKELSKCVDAPTCVK